MELDINSKTEKNIFLLITIIGITEALLKGAMTIEEAEQTVFSPYSVRVLEEQEIDSEIINLISLGTELEDIESLLPHLLDTEVLKIRDKALGILSSIQKPDIMEKWLVEK